MIQIIGSAAFPRQTLRNLEETELFCNKNFEETELFAIKNLEETDDPWYSVDRENGGVQCGGVSMYFKRKVYNKLLEWKEQYADRYAVLLEGARRVGKSTIAEHFAAAEYRSYILIDFSSVSSEILACFDTIHQPDLFFLRLQAITGISLYEHESVLIFDEVQLFPKARQAIKHLVKYGKYHYIETGSLISIKKNVKDILIPSEEITIQVYPMDYEEFCDATGANYKLLESVFDRKQGIGQQANRALLRDVRLYIAVGGMPQAVEAYVEGNNFSMIDQIKRQIIYLYEEDFKKNDPSGRLSAMYHSIPAQLSKGTRRYHISTAVGKKKTSKDESLLYDLIDSKTVLPCYNVTDPRVSLSLTKNTASYKMYVGDTGLFVTLMFIDRPTTENELYVKLLADKLPANLGYLYENLVAQMLAASGRELYYHTWEKEGSSHCYEIDFLISHGSKLSAIEVKSSGTGKHTSLTEFTRKYSKNVSECIVVSQKDVERKQDITYLPVYLTPFLAAKGGFYTWR